MKDGVDFRARNTQPESCSVSSVQSLILKSQGKPKRTLWKELNRSDGYPAQRELTLQKHFLLSAPGSPISAAQPNHDQTLPGTRGHRSHWIVPWEADTMDSNRVEKSKEAKGRQHNL